MSCTVSTKSGRAVELRFLSTDDRSGLVGFFSSLSPQALQWGMPPYTEEVIDRWIGNLANLIALVAVHGKAIVGYAMISKGTHPRRQGVGDLAIYLHQDFQNDGLGTAMLRRLLALAKDEGLHKVTVHVIADNKPAVSLYEKLGLQHEGTLKDSYLGGDNRYHDELVLGLVFADSKGGGDFLTRS